VSTAAGNLNRRLEDSSGNPDLPFASKPGHPKTTRNWHPDDPGFHLQAQFIHVLAYGVEDIPGFELYSEKGEVPINLPSDIELEMLMRIDKKILSDKDHLAKFFSRT
jgi:hypothetical protein